MPFWFLLKGSEQLTSDKREALVRLSQVSSVIRRANNFGQILVRMVRYRFSKLLDLWPKTVIKHKVPELETLTKSLKQDK